MPKYNGIPLKENDYNVIVNIEKWVEEPLTFEDFYPDLEPSNQFFAREGRITNLILTSENQHIPLQLFDLDALEILIFVDSPIVKFPNDLSKLQSLEILFLEMCEEFSIIPESIGELINLRELIIEGSKLKNIPMSIKKLKNLKNLQLNGDDLHFIPDELGYLESLEYFFLMDNHLKTIPETIGNLKLLKVIQLENNEITSLPQSIKSLNSLKSLHLSDNKILNIPNEILSLVSLKTLFLRGNKLTSLPEFSEFYQKLKRIGIDVII